MTPPRTIETRLTRKAGAVFPGAVVYCRDDGTYYLDDRSGMTTLGSDYASAFRGLLAMMSAARAAQKVAP